MQKCWLNNPDDRPTFSELALTKEDMLTEVSDYLELKMDLKEDPENPGINLLVEIIYIIVLNSTLATVLESKINLYKVHLSFYVISPSLNFSAGSLFGGLSNVATMDENTAYNAACDNYKLSLHSLTST